MYLFFTFTGGRGRFDRRERERASATCRRWWYLRGGDGVIYLGILEGVSFFFFSFLVGGRLVRVNGDDICFFVQNRDLLYIYCREKKSVVREEEDT